LASWRIAGPANVLERLGQLVSSLRNYGFRLENYGRSRQRRPPYFLNSRLIKAAGEFKGQDHSHQQALAERMTPTRMTAATAAQNSLPAISSWLMPQASEGQSLQGREPKFTAIAG